MTAAEEEVSTIEAASAAAVTVVVDETRADNNITIYLFGILSLSFAVSPLFSFFFSGGVR